MDVDLQRLSPNLAYLPYLFGVADERILVEQSSNNVGHYHPRFRIVAAKITKHNPAVRKAGLSRGLGHGCATTNRRQKLQNKYIYCMNIFSLP